MFSEFMVEKLPLKWWRFALRFVRRLGGPAVLFDLARVCYRLKIYDEEYIPSRGPVIFVFNHVLGIADGLIYLLIHKYFPQAYLMEWSFADSALPGLFEALGVAGFSERQMLVHRHLGSSTAGLLQAYRILQQGGAAVVAPEGEPTWDGRLAHPFSPGAAWLALRSGAPVLPIVSRGGYDIQPLWRLERVALTGRLSIRVGKPLILADKPVQPDEAVIAAATQRIENVLSGLYGQMER